MSRQDKLFAVLGLFTQEQATWTVTAAADALGMPTSTAYRYFNNLTAAGFTVPLGGGNYVLGPAIMQLDRQMRLTDPLIKSARPLMRTLVAMGTDQSVAVLCRWFHDQVMCVHEEFSRRPLYDASYERGLPMAAHRGAPAKAILAHLPIRTARMLFESQKADYENVGLGRDWVQVRATLRQLRTQAAVITAGELTSGFTGIASPIFDPSGPIIGSVAIITPDSSASLPFCEAATRVLVEVSSTLTQSLRELLTTQRASVSADHEPPKPSRARSGEGSKGPEAL